MSYQSKNTDEHVTFADALLSKRYRKAQNDFLNQIDTLIDWRPIRTLINKKYTKRKNAIGAPAYDVILLFKMLLLEIWYNLRDCALEERINDSIEVLRASSSARGIYIHFHSLLPSLSLAPFMRKTPFYPIALFFKGLIIMVVWPLIRSWPAKTS